MDMRPWCAACVIFFLCHLLALTDLWSATYFVDSRRGDDRFSGLSRNEPWKSLDKVNNARFSPGDRVLLRRGRLWHGSLLIVSSGSGKAPVIIGAYGPEGDDKPVISGFLPDDSWCDWSEEANGIYSTSINCLDISPPSLLSYKGTSRPPLTILKFEGSCTLPSSGAVILQLDGTYRSMWLQSVHGDTVSGYALRPLVPGIRVHVREIRQGREDSWPDTLSAPVAVSDVHVLEEPGHWFVDRKSNRLYIRATESPRSGFVKISARSCGIRVSGSSHVEIRDIKVRGFNETGVWIHKSSYVTLSGVEVEDIGSRAHRSGILIFDARRCTVTDCTVRSALGNGIVVYASPQALNGASWNRIENCTVIRSGAAGISLATDGHDFSYLLHDNSVMKNVVEYSNAFSYDAAGIYLMYTGTGNMIRNNIVRHGGSRELRSCGIMLDTGSRGVTVDYNRLYDNSLAGIAVTGKGHVISHNIIANNGMFSWETAQFVLFAVDENAGSCTFTHNRLEASRGQMLIMQTVISEKGRGGNEFDYNTYVAKDEKTFCWSDGMGCRKWLDFNAWKKVSRGDRHSTFTCKNP